MSIGEQSTKIFGAIALFCNKLTKTWKNQERGTKLRKSKGRKPQDERSYGKHENVDEEQKNKNSITIKNISNDNLQKQREITTTRRKLHENKRKQIKHTEKEKKDDD